MLFHIVRALIAITAAVPLSLTAQVYTGLPGDATFLGRPTIPDVEGVPYLADFNGDGNLDILSTNTGALSLLYGDGKGHFSPGPISNILADNTTPGQVIDLNGDGIPDFLFSDATQNFYIAYGNADGTFQKAAKFKTDLTCPGIGQSCVTSVVAADLDGDGKPDIVAEGPSGWEVFLNNGAGFTPGQQEIVGQSESAPVYVGFAALGDINNDGIPDLVYARYAKIHTCLGTGTGTFEICRALDIPEPPSSLWEYVVLGDWNGDGNLDLIVTSDSAFTYRVAGNGNDSFQPPIEMRPPGPAAPYLIADFNGDGIPDIAALGADAYLFTGEGGGKFAAPTRFALSFDGAVGAATGSLRNNGRVDIVAGTFGGQDLLFSVGSGFEEPLSLSAPGAISIATADINGDGHPDLITVGSNGIQVLWGTGNAIKPFTQGLNTPSPNAGYFTLGDFNGDGFLDVAVNTINDIGGTDGQVSVYLGDGTGNFATPPLVTQVGFGWTYLAAGDLNGDGKLDIVTNIPSVLFGNGDGTFQPPIIYSGAYMPFATVRVQDLNGDGKPDIFTTQYYGYPTPPPLLVYLNKGDGSFGPPASYGSEAETGDAAGYNVACDVNGDGLPDIVTAGGPNLEGGFLPLVELNSGNGTFTQAPKSSYAGYEFSTAVACARFTSSGTLPDLAVVSNVYGEMQMYLNAGAGVFNGSVMGWGPGYGPLDLVAGKFHGRSKVDDLAILNSDGTITILINLE